MNRRQILAFAARLQAARVILVDTDPALRAASDRLIGVLTAIHDVQRWTQAELALFGRIQMTTLTRFWRERANPGHGYSIDNTRRGDLQSSTWENWD